MTSPNTPNPSPEEPNYPPKREVTPVPVPTVSVGKNQVCEHDFCAHITSV